MLRNRHRQDLHRRGNIVAQDAGAKGFVISDFLKAEISAAENFSKYQRFSATVQNQ